MFVPEQKPPRESNDYSGGPAFGACQECSEPLGPHDEFFCGRCDITLSAAEDATWD